MQYALSIIAKVIGLLFFALVAYKGLGNAYNAFIYGEFAYGERGLYAWPAKSMVPIGAAMICIQLAIETAKKICDFAKGRFSIEKVGIFE